MQENSSVRHNEPESRFELVVDRQVAFAAYRHAPDATMVFHHTLVPESLRGRGLAGRVVRAGLEYARDEGFKVVPACSYVARFIATHPEFESLLTDTAGPDRSL